MQTQRVSIIVTKTCTLECRLCGALAPYVNNYNPTGEYLKGEIDAFFNIVRKTGIVDISGGEPFLCGGNSNFSLGEVLPHLCDLYAGRFERIRIFTNGTVVPGDALCDVFRYVAKRAPFDIVIDDYGKNSPKVEAVAGKLRRHEIDFTIRDYAKDIHCDGWVDLRDISRKHDLRGARELFLKCAIPQKLGCCLELLHGIMTPCSVVAARYLCGQIDAGSDDVVDLSMEPAKAKEKLQNILSAEHFDSCRYCDGGMAADSRRFVPAEQAAREEIAQWRKTHPMRNLLPPLPLPASRRRTMGSE